MVEWESGEVTYEPLALIFKDDPITCAVYAKKHDLLDTTGWKHLKRYAKTSKRLIRAVKQSRIRQVRASARYQHGFQVPKDYNDAIILDKENSNTHWQDAMDLELTQIHEYKVFKDTGKAQFHNGKVVTPDGFQKIRVHFVYAVKHDGRFKARLVADGHLTKEPVESIYSGVVSLRSLRMVVFLFQLNNLEIWGADVENAYLEAYTDEKLCIIVGPEFKELQGHLLIMIKALHGTYSGGARWHDRIFDILRELKFKPSKADLDVWMRPEPGGTCYEYIAVYVDDLAIAAKDPQAFCNELKKKYNVKLNGVGPLEYHLGCTYKKDPDGTLAADPRRYVNKILESYERMFKEKPRKSRPPLEGGDHPELDTSELCDDHQTKQFQTLIGQLQWLISLGPFDNAVHVMSLSRFRAQPTVFFGVLHPQNVHNLMGWVQEYEKKSNEKVRFPYSRTLSMYSKNENFFDTSPLICLPPHLSHSSRPTSKVTPQEQPMEGEGTADEGVEAGHNADEGNDDEMYLFSDDDSEDIEAELDKDSISTEDPLPNAISFPSDGRLKLLRLL